MKKNRATSSSAEAGQRPSERFPRGSAGEEARRRLQPIIEAAEQAASGIIDDAEAEARQYLAESRRRADRAAEQRAGEMAALAEELLLASARLLATQMAILGSSREAIASRLRDEFGIEEPDPILDPIMRSDA